MSAEDLEKYETEMELNLYREYRDVVGIFKYVVETDRRFYLCNQVDVKARTEAGDVFFEVTLTDAWVWDMYRPARRLAKNVKVLTFKDVNVEELSHSEIEPPEGLIGTRSHGLGWHQPSRGREDRRRRWRLPWSAASSCCRLRHHEFGSAEDRGCLRRAQRARTSRRRDTRHCNDLLERRTPGLVARCPEAGAVRAGRVRRRRSVLLARRTTRATRQRQHHHADPCPATA